MTSAINKARAQRHTGDAIDGRVERINKLVALCTLAFLGATLGAVRAQAQDSPDAPAAPAPTTPAEPGAAAPAEPNPPSSPGVVAPADLPTPVAPTSPAPAPSMPLRPAPLRPCRSTAHRKRNVRAASGSAAQAPQEGAPARNRSGERSARGRAGYASGGSARHAARTSEPVPPPDSEKANDDEGLFGPFRVGFLDGGGLPDLVSLSGMIKLTRYFGAGINAGLIPTVKRSRCTAPPQSLFKSTTCTGTFSPSAARFSWALA